MLFGFCKCHFKGTRGITNLPHMSAIRHSNAKGPFCLLCSDVIKERELKAASMPVQQKK
jgi:hypothetical protein